MVFFENRDISLDSFSDVGYGFIFHLTLADTTWKTKAFSNPVLILTEINHHLSRYILLLWL